VAIVNLDGTQYRRILVEQNPGNYNGGQPSNREMSPRWGPTGSWVVYQDGGDLDRLYRADTSGTLIRVLSGSPFASEIHADVSRDGAWIYFASWTPTVESRSLWRVHPEGAGLEQLPPAVDGTSDSRPSVSPDGMSVAYCASSLTWNGSRVRVRSVATAARTALDVRGTTPRWSPDGSWIAYIDSYDISGYSGPLKVTRPDGTGDRQVSTGEFMQGIDWSPDGRYVIAKEANNGRLELIEVATGVRIPLPMATAHLSNPSWRPGSTP
jgi:Tol biopolymer transport system component